MNFELFLFIGLGLFLIFTGYTIAKNKNIEDYTDKRNKNKIDDSKNATSTVLGSFIILIGLIIILIPITTAFLGDYIRYFFALIIIMISLSIIIKSKKDSKN